MPRNEKGRKTLEAAGATEFIIKGIQYVGKSHYLNRLTKNKKSEKPRSKIEHPNRRNPECPTPIKIKDLK